MLNWEISNSLDGLFCRQGLEKSLEIYGKPEIFNTDQGRQFTSKKFTKILKDSDIQISMDGRGRALDNVFVERLWRSLKYEYVYLNAPDTGKELWKGLKWLVSILQFGARTSKSKLPNSLGNLSTRIGKMRTF